MSNDDVGSHDAWIAKLGIPFQLVADTEHVALEAYGVWAEKEWDGKRYMGVSRTTFLVGPDGRIARVWESVKPSGHAEEVLAALRESKGGG